MNPNTQCDVLLVTVTDVETDSLLETARTQADRDYVLQPGEHKTYYDLGIIGGARVFAVRSEMGSDTLGGSLLTVKDAIAEVKPSSVIMVGIAFGVNPKKQKIGEILVAKQLQAYDLQRVGTTETGDVKIILRGDKPHCSEKLLDRFRTTRQRWKKAEVNFGLVGDLVEFEGGTVVQHDLEHLSPQAGAQVLRSLKVKGDTEELEEAAKELDGHAFSLTLLGSYLDEVLDGDIRRRKEIENLFDDTRHGDNAQKMIAAYETWLGEGMELAILRLLGLFDRPANGANIAALREAPC